MRKVIDLVSVMNVNDAIKELQKFSKGGTKARAFFVLKEDISKFVCELLHSSVKNILFEIKNAYKFTQANKEYMEDFNINYLKVLYVVVVYNSKLLTEYEVLNITDFDTSNITDTERMDALDDLAKSGDQFSITRKVAMAKVDNGLVLTRNYNDITESIGHSFRDLVDMTVIIKRKESNKDYYKFDVYKEIEEI